MRVIHASILAVFVLATACGSDKPVDPNKPMRTLTIAVVGSGTTDPAPGAHQYREGTQVAVKATPANGATFTGWTGASTGTDAQVVVTIEGDQTLTAQFSPPPTRTLTVDVVGNGNTDPAPGAHQYAEGTQVTVKATPATGATFAGWAGAASGKDGQVVIKVQGDQTLTALFTDSAWPTGPAVTYDNPILPGDHPDLNIYAEGKDFYLCGSNFAMFPALEILHSTDLLHWERVSRVVDASSPALVGQLDPGQGTWGAFIVKPTASLYRIYFAIKATQYFSEASSLAGPWSEPTKVASVWVSPAEGVDAVDRGTGSDNSVFIDDDTNHTTYMVTKNGIGQWTDAAQVGDWGMNRLIAIDPATGQLIPESMINLDFVNYYDAKGGGGPRDNTDWSHWAEGPTLVKRNGWYYYYVQTHTACGGKSDVWASQELSSDASKWHWLDYVMGPGTPYGGIQHPTAPFQIADDTWWQFAHSYDCTDNDGTLEHHGEWLGLAREGLLHQVTWVDKVVDGVTIPVPHVSEDARNLPAPALAQSGTPFLIPVNDDFSGTKLGTAWTTYADMGKNLSLVDGKLRITPDAISTAWALQKEALRSTASIVKLDFTPTVHGDKDTSPQDAAGICVRNGFWKDEQILKGPQWIEGEGKMVGIFDVQVARTIVDKKDVIRFAYRARTPVSASWDGTNGVYTAMNDPVVVSYTAPAPTGSTVWLKLVRSNHVATGWFSTDRITWTKVGQAINIKALDDNYGMSNAWIGNQAGMFATNMAADFELFTYRDGLTSIPATATDQQSGTAIVDSATQGKVLGSLENGDWALYAGLDLGSGGVSAKSVQLEASSVGGGWVEFWIDPLAGGPHFGPCAVADTGSWETFNVSSCPVTASGTHDVYVKVVGKTGELMRIASLQFAP